MSQSSLVEASLFEIIRNSSTAESKHNPVSGYLGTNVASELLEEICNKEAITKITVNYNGYSFSLLEVSFSKNLQSLDRQDSHSQNNTYAFKAKDVVLERES